MVNEPDEPRPKQISFDFEKSPQFRTIHVDGVIGGPSPQGLLQLALFSERLPIPKSVTHEINDAGNLGAETSRVGRTNFYREVEVNVLMTLSAARSLHQWLGEKITQLEVLVAAKKGPDSG